MFLMNSGSANILLLCGGEQTAETHDNYEYIETFSTRHKKVNIE